MTDDIVNGTLEELPPLRLGFCHAYDARRGGLGDVYLCQRDIKPSKVAVKRLHDEIARVPGAAQLFVDECVTWMRLPPHPNVVNAISAHWAEPEPPLVVLEYVPRSLREVLASGPLSPAETVLVAIDVCDGLTHIDAVTPGFVHQDLKPENILIDDDRRAKVTDFGLAKVRHHAATHEQQGRVEATGLVGTPAYMSPEQCLLLPTSTTSDVYSFGCMLWEMVSGRHPYPGLKDVEDYLDAHVRIDPTLDLPHDADPATIQLRALAHECLSKNPEARPSSFLDLRSRLGHIASTLQLSIPAPAEVGPVEYDTLLQRAQGLVALGALDEARTIAQRVFDEADRNDGKLWAATLIARTYSDEKRRDLAASWIEVGHDWRDDVDPVIVGAYWNEAARVADDPADAERYFRRALDLVPEASIGWWNLALLQYNLGKAREAFESARTALRSSRDLRYYVGFVQMLCGVGQYEKAMEVANAAVNDHPTSPEAWASFATVFVAQEELHADPASLGRELLRLWPLAAEDPDSWALAVDELFDKQPRSVEPEG